MAAGIEIFREHFKDYADQYVVIGGMACDLLLNDAGLDLNKDFVLGVYRTIYLKNE